MIPGQQGMSHLEPQHGSQASSLEDVVKVQIDRYGVPWVDQLNYHTMLTVQALQRLHSAFDGKFSR